MWLRIAIECSTTHARRLTPFRDSISDSGRVQRSLGEELHLQGSESATVPAGRREPNPNTVTRVPANAAIADELAR